MPVIPYQRALWRAYRKALKTGRLITLAPYLTLGWVKRSRLSRPLFVGITGSHGKTTTKELTAAALSAGGPVSKNRESYNSRHEVVRTLLRTRPDTFACVMELGLFDKGSLDVPLRIFRPTLGIVTHIKRDHYTAFRSAEAIAAEKSKLAAALPAGGTLILNADDPLVLAMAARSRARLVTFGLGPEAQVRAEALSSAWPEPLSGVIVVRGERFPFRTQLHGLHWAHAVLAAVTTAVEAGISPAAALQAIAAVLPVRGRYSPVTAGGVTFIGDTRKATWDSMPAMLQFLESARAPRRILVFGTISDYPGAGSPKYRRVAYDAARFCERVVFIGEGAKFGYPEHERRPDGRIAKFATLAEADAYLHGCVAPGDLVFLKGSATDRLDRIMEGWESGIGCLRAHCRRLMACVECRRWRPRR